MRAKKQEDRRIFWERHPTAQRIGLILSGFALFTGCLETYNYVHGDKKDVVPVEQETIRDKIDLLLASPHSGIANIKQ